ncbi:MAG TPA: hypothetical protein VH575_01075 [Gemmataceae bacterium]
MSRKLAKSIRAIGVVLAGASLGTFGAGLYGLLFFSLFQLAGGASGRAASIRLSWVILSGAIAGAITGIAYAIDAAGDERMPFEERDGKAAKVHSKEKRPRPRWQCSRITAQE